jgi:hypothetical protein
MSNAVAVVAAAPSEPEWAAFAAIDWADQKNFWRLLPAGSRKSEAGELDSTPEAVEVWAANLQQRFGDRPIAVILEQSRGPLVYMLTKYPHLVLFPVHPTTAARYRETFAPSGAKSDPSDTDSLLDLLLRHRERLRPLRPDTVETRLLHFLVEERRQTVDEKTRANLRLTDCLKLYFPQVLRWFDDVTSPLVGDLLERWPTLEQLQRVHPGTLRRFFHEHNCRSEEKNAERVAAIQQATSATQDQAVREACVLIAHSLVAMLKTLRAQIDVFDKRIAELVAGHPDGALFRSLPGRRRRPGAAHDCGLRNAAGSLPERIRDAVLQRYRPGHRGQWQQPMGAFPLHLPEVSAPDVSRVCGLLDPAIGVGPCLLRPPAQR